MASCNHIITLALSKLGVAGGQKKPRAEDLALGLATLKSLYGAAIEAGTLGRAQPVLVSTDYVARENDRILRTADAVGDISLPLTVPMTLTPINGSCGAYDYSASQVVCGSRPPRNGSFVVINDAVSGNSIEAIYDGHRNSWVFVNDLTLDDDTEIKTADGVLLELRTSYAPLSTNSNGLAAKLALLLADHFQATPSPLTIRDAERFDSGLVHGFGEPRSTQPSVYF